VGPGGFEQSRGVILFMETAQYLLCELLCGKGGHSCAISLIGVSHHRTRKHCTAQLFHVTAHPLKGITHSPRTQSGKASPPSPLPLHRHAIAPRRPWSSSALRRAANAWNSRAIVSTYGDWREGESCVSHLSGAARPTRPTAPGLCAKGRGARHRDEVTLSCVQRFPPTFPLSPLP